VGFNPTRVRLKPAVNSEVFAPTACFNPTRVRLKPVGQALPAAARDGFNPTRVRLKRLTGRELSSMI